eukprot:jgi/Tetstr1/436455/TSEL_025283.t1
MEQLRDLTLEAFERGVRDLREEEVPEIFRGEWTDAPGEHLEARSPRLDVECRVFRSSVFKRIPMALIKVEGEFQAFIVVAEAKDACGLPIFGAEVVSRNGQVTVAFADCSPVTADRNLPPLFKERIQHLQSAHGVTSMPVRKIPPEFKEVFSDLCVVNMPRDGAMDGYLGYVRDALKEYLALPQSPLDSFGETEAKDIAAKQRAYMELGLSNAEKKVAPTIRRCASPERSARFLKWFWLGEL